MRSMRGVLHLGVEDAGIGLHNAHSAIEGLESEESALTVGQNGRNVETEILRVHLGSKGEADGFLRLGRNLETVPRSSQVANDLAVLIQIPQASTEEVDGDRVWLIVGERNQSLRWAAVDELDTEDLRVRERGVHLDGEIRGTSSHDVFIGTLEAEEESRSVNCVY